MAKAKGNILYKIYYEDEVVYLGRTKQPLQDRLRGHLFKKPMHRSIDINIVTKIEYAEFKTEADMYLYEVYYINTLKPPLNVDDRACDDITVTLPDVKFQEFVTYLWDKWKDEINNRVSKRQKDMDKYYKFSETVSILRLKHKTGEISKEEWEEQYETLKEERKELEKRLFR